MLVIAAVILGLGAATLEALIAWRVRHARPGRNAAALPASNLRVLPEPQPPALERPAEVHLPFHGLSAEDVAAIIERGRQDR